MLNIRTATTADANSLAAFAEKSFREAFVYQNTVEDMELHCQICYGEQIQHAEISHPDYLTLLLEHKDELIAYAQLRWTETPSCISAQSAGEIQRLYVDAAWHGQGVAQSLMQACLSELSQRDKDLVWLGVWEHNQKAITFYQKFGFQPVGNHLFMLGNDQQRDIIMARPTDLIASSSV